MTPTQADREKAIKIVMGDFDKPAGLNTMRAFWDELETKIAQALADQREEDAKIADIQGNLNPRDCTHVPCKDAQKIATAIRKGKP